MTQALEITPLNIHILLDGLLQPFIEQANIHFCLGPINLHSKSFLSYSLTITTISQEYGSIIKHVGRHKIQDFSTTTFFRQGFKRPTFIIECCSEKANLFNETLYLEKIWLVDDKQTIEVHYGELEIGLYSILFHIYDYYRNPLLTRCKTRSFKVNSVELPTQKNPLTFNVVAL
jgi:hypothetical protein